MHPPYAAPAGLYLFGHFPRLAELESKPRNHLVVHFVGVAAWIGEERTSSKPIWEFPRIGGLILGSYDKDAILFRVRVPYSRKLSVGLYYGTKQCQ